MSFHFIIIFFILIYRNIDNVDQTMDEINEQTENLKQIQEALSAPIGAAADFDEVETFFLSSILYRNLNGFTSNFMLFTPNPHA